MIIRWLRRTRGEASCREVGRALQSYLDGEVEPDFTAKIEAHLEKCRRCGLERQTYESIKESLSRQVPSVDQDAIDRLREFGRTLTSE